ncbi:MAG: hypothetical protein HON40_00105 [Flavobacteriales bacterium]|nr:hypothetical protein [Flavobacteriales bacterium]
MKKLLLILIALPMIGIGQSDKKITKIYGGMPTSNENMGWEEDKTPNEKYSGVIKIDSTISASEVIEAFMITFQPLQDANIMTKQMRNNNAFGAVASSLSGDYNSMDDFTKAGDADSRRQNQAQSSWSVQFIDGVRLSRFYYNISVQVRNGRYKLVVIPAGTSGYANDHIQTEWSQMFKKGEVKSIYSKYYSQMKIKLAYTIDQWISNVDEHLIKDGNDDW